MLTTYPSNIQSKSINYYANSLNTKDLRYATNYVER